MRCFSFKCEMRLTFVLQTWLISQMLSQNMQLLEFLSKLCGLRLVRRFLRSEITYNTSLTTAFQTIKVPQLRIVVQARFLGFVIGYFVLRGHYLTRQLIT